jgi:hypothetical protein
MLKLKYFLLAFALLGAISSCDVDPPLPDITASFETDVLGFEGTETDVTVVLSRASDVDVVLDVALAPVNVTYGQQFTTDPAAVDNKVELTIPAGSTEGNITVMKTENTFLNGDESIVFTLETPTAPVLPGEETTLTLSFVAITSTGSNLTLAGKTDVSPYANAVYVDLSANKGTPVDRKSWNIAFLSGSDFKVILNPGYQTTAAPLAKTDITAVTIDDAELVPNLAHDAIVTQPEAETLADHWTGDLAKTTFATVSATESENKVYLLSFEGSKAKDTWFKVKVTRNGDNYRVQYARIGETTINTLDVPKNPAYNATFVSLETKSIVPVEPEKGNWDIEWAYSTTNSGFNTPYWAQDFILLNYLGGAEALEVVSTTGVDAAANIALATAAYTSFAEADLAGKTFVKSRDAIGTKWRLAGGPGVTNPGIRKDRFYVVKDPRGNYYKLKFISYGVPTGDGERGRPVIEYALVKSAS